MAHGAAPIEAMVVGATVALAHTDPDLAIARFGEVLERYPREGRSWSGLGMASLLKHDLPAAAVQRLFEAVIDETRSLEREMTDAAQELAYERAARLRDRLLAVRRAIEKQQMVGERSVGGIRTSTGDGVAWSTRDMFESLLYCLFASWTGFGDQVPAG